MPTAIERLQKLGDGYEKRFSKHQISSLPSKSWKVQDPASGFYWFCITWSPGSLVLTGDCYTMILTHYAAMGTHEEAAHWVYGSSYDYLMEKSDAEKVYSPKATAEHFGYHLFEDRCKRLHKKDCDECDRWRKCMQRFEDHIENKYFGELPKRKREDVVRFVHEIVGNSQDDAYDLFAHVFRDASEMLQYEYPELTKTQYAAFQTWARLVTQPVSSSLPCSS